MIVLTDNYYLILEMVAFDYDLWFFQFRVILVVHKYSAILHIYIVLYSVYIHKEINKEKV